MSADAQDIDRAIADRAAIVLPSSGNVMTCDDGVACSAIVAAFRAGKRLHAYVCETRPSLSGQGAFDRLEAARVPATLIVDASSALVMRTHDIAATIVAACHVAENGDTRSVVGTYALAVLASHHGVPFYILAARSAVGESRASDEEIAGGSTDVTPGHLITGIITEYGLARPPYYESIPDLATRPAFAVIANATRR